MEAFLSQEKNVWLNESNDRVKQPFKQKRNSKKNIKLKQHQLASIDRMVKIESGDYEFEIPGNYPSKCEHNYTLPPKEISNQW